MRPALGQRRPATAAGMFGTAIAAAGATLVLYLRSAGTLTEPTGERVGDAISVILVLAMSTVGAVLATHRPANPIGWLFLAGGLAVQYSAFAGVYALHGIFAHPGSLPAADVVLWSGLVG